MQNRRILSPGLRLFDHNVQLKAVLGILMSPIVQTHNPSQNIQCLVDHIKTSSAQCATVSARDSGQCNPELLTALIKVDLKDRGH